MKKTKPTRVKDIGRVVTGKTPATNISENFGGEYMFVTPVELHTDFIIRESQKTLSKQGIDSIRSNSICGPSIAVGCIGWDMGNVALIEEECATNQQINSITDIKPEYNLYFLYYWFLTKKEYLFRIATVTRTPILNKTTFEDILVPMPSKSVQDSIVELLLPISKKIFLNNLINAELEKTAKLLFDYWFVQFDFPNIEGKPYRFNGGELVYNEQSKTKVPKGWRVETLKSLTNIALGGTPSTANEEYWGDEFRWLNSGEVANFPVVSSELGITQKGIDNSATKLMPVGTTVVSITGNIRASVLAIESCANQSVVGIYETDKLKHSYIYPLISSLLNKYAAISTGNCQTHINKGTIEDTVVVVPPEAILESYNAICAPIYKKIQSTALQNKELISLRNFFLPLLMNGQITVEAGDER